MKELELDSTVEQREELVNLSQENDPILNTAHLIKPKWPHPICTFIYYDFCLLVNPNYHLFLLLNNTCNLEAIQVPLR